MARFSAAQASRGYVPFSNNQEAWVANQQKKWGPRMGGMVSQMIADPAYAGVVADPGNEGHNQAATYMFNNPGMGIADWYQSQGIGTPQMSTPLLDQIGSVGTRDTSATRTASTPRGTYTGAWSDSPFASAVSQDPAAYFGRGEGPPDILGIGGAPRASTVMGDGFAPGNDAPWPYPYQDYSGRGVAGRQYPWDTPIDLFPPYLPPIDFRDYGQDTPTYGVDVNEPHAQGRTSQTPRTGQPTSVSGRTPTYGVDVNEPYTGLPHPNPRTPQTPIGTDPTVIDPGGGRGRFPNPGGGVTPAPGGTPAPTDITDQTLWTNTPSYNTDFWQNLFGWDQQNQNNPFINSSGGFNFGAVPGMYDFLIQTMNPAARQALLSGAAGSDFMASQIFGGFPNDARSYLDQMIGTQGLEGENLRTAGYNYLWDYLDSLGTDTIPGLMQGDIPQPHIGGQFGELAEEQNEFGTGMQGETGSRLLEALAGGGLTPEYVDAMREMVLAPQQESLQNRLAGQGGGITSPTGGLRTEMQRRNERDFSNQLAITGADRYNQMLNMAGNLSQNAIQQALYGYGGGIDAGRLGLQGMGMGNQFAYQPYLTGLGAAGQTGGFAQNLLSQYMGAGLGHSQNQMGFGSNLLRALAGSSGDVLRAMMQDQALRTQQDISGNQLAGSGAGLLASIFGGLF